MRKKHVTPNRISNSAPTICRTNSPWAFDLRQPEVIQKRASGKLASSAKYPIQPSVLWRAGGSGDAHKRCAQRADNPEPILEFTLLDKSRADYESMQRCALPSSKPRLALSDIGDAEASTVML